MSKRLRRGLLSLLGVGTAAASFAAPTASITYPVNLTLSNVYSTQGGSADVGVIGTASAPNLRDWTLQYKPAAAPTWTLIKFSTQAVTNGLLWTWSTLGPDGSFNVNGAYNLQLIVCDTSSVCATTTVNDTLSNFSLTQSTPSGQPELNTPVGQRITYTAILPWSLSITLSLKNLAGTIVKSVGGSTSGTWTYQWDGTNTGGVRVPDGPYFVSAFVTDGTNSLNWDQSLQYRDDSIVSTYAPPTAFDPFNNDPLPITYNFPVGRVTIAASPDPAGEIPSACPPVGGFCVLDQKYEESGQHTIQWPAVDASGRFHPELGSLAVISDRKTFSRNAVVLYGTKPTVSNVHVTPPVAWSGASQTIEFDVAGPTSISSRSVTFLNQESATVLRTLTSASCVGSHCTVVWDGKATNGMLVAPGGYTITASATDTLGNTASSQGLAFIQY